MPDPNRISDNNIGNNINELDVSQSPETLIIPGSQVDDVDKRVRALETNSSVGSGTNAATLNGIGGSATPVASKFVALDVNAKFPFSTVSADKGTTTFAAATSRYVSSTSMAATSRVFITPQASQGGVNFWIVEKNAATSFRISADAANSLTFDWFIWD